MVFCGLSDTIPNKFPDERDKILEGRREYSSCCDSEVELSDLLNDNDFTDYISVFKRVSGIEIPYRTSWSGEMEASMQGQAILISALAIYKQWKKDNGYGNSDSYSTLSEKFRKDHIATACLIDLIQQQ